MHEGPELRPVRLAELLDRQQPVSRGKKNRLAFFADDEAALLAAVLPSPKRFRVDRPSPYVQQRQAWILRQMAMLGGVRMLDSLDDEPARR